MKPRAYGLAEAKAKLAEIVDRAQHDGPQQINRRGHPAAFVVSAAQWQPSTPPAPGTSLLDWLKRQRILGLGVELELPPDPPLRRRNADL